MSLLTADDLAAAHPYLPDGWRRGMTGIRRDGGPWPCRVCDGPSYLLYRCSKCGADLVGQPGRRSPRR